MTDTPTTRAHDASEPVLTNEQRESWDLLSEQWGESSGIKGTPFTAVARRFAWIEEQYVWYKDQLTMANEHFQASERDLATARAERDFWKTRAEENDQDYRQLTEAFDTSGLTLYEDDIPEAAIYVNSIKKAGEQWTTIVAHLDLGDTDDDVPDAVLKLQGAYDKLDDAYEVMKHAHDATQGELTTVRADLVEAEASLKAALKRETRDNTAICELNNDLIRMHTSLTEARAALEQAQRDTSTLSGELRKATDALYREWERDKIREHDFLQLYGLLGQLAGIAALPAAAPGATKEE